jgi:hypothetical protein
VIALQHFGKPMADPLPPEVDRKMRLVAFSQLVQQLFKGEVEAESRSNPCDLYSVHIPAFVARGLIEGAIVHLGPSYEDAISPIKENRKWKASFERWYQTSEDLTMLRKMDEAYSSTLLKMDQKDLSKISCIRANKVTRVKDALSDDDWLSASASITTGGSRYALWKGKTMRERLDNTSTGARRQSRRFFGSNRTMGLVPPEARRGDLICQFWGCNVAAVVRWIPDDDSFYLIGRADVATAWQITEGQPITIKVTNSFEGGGVTNLHLHTEVLQKLTC